MKALFPLCFLMGLLTALLSADKIDGFLLGSSGFFLVGSTRLLLKGAARA